MTTSLSELWRENRSKDPGTDLASILDGARIIAQSLVPKTEVIFAGIDTANTDRKQIALSSKILDAAIATNNFPVSGDVVDVLLGLTVHEIGHILFSDNKVGYLAKLENKSQVYRPEDRQAFGKLIDIFEDIYVDHLMTAYPGYRDYLYRERAWALGGFNPNSVTKPLEAECTRKDILNAMIYLTLAGGKMPKNISQENVKTLGIIATYANKMCTKKLSKSSAVIGAWKILKKLPAMLTDSERGFGKPTPAPDTDNGKSKPAPEQVHEDAESEQEAQEKLEKQEDLEGETEAEAKAEKEQGELDGEKSEEEAGEDKPPETEEDEETDSSEEDVDEEAGEGVESGVNEEEIEPDPNLDLASELDSLVNDYTRLPKNLAEDVSEAIVEKRDDLSQLLSLLAKDSSYTILAYTPKEDAKRAAEVRSKTASTEEKLRRILQDYRLRRTRDYRGLMSGRISARRLHRVAYGDQRVFQRREKPEEIDMAVCLLMDLSGSVHPSRDLIEQITCAISDAFTKEKMEFIALGYSESYGTVTIPRLYDREVQRVNLGLDKEWQMTPSYEGLAAAIAQLLRLAGKKQKVLFHFTDGGPNTGPSHIIPELLDDARAKGITDIHICLTSRDYTTERFKHLW
uniref:Putative von Willebrand domain containing protein n=2 Tax=viral metagenome TaxID=1070528 RepID=A0A6M3M684_9ZZZZ